VNIFVLIIAITSLWLFTPVNAETKVEKWSRYSVSLVNNTYSDNPFRLILDATFIHTNTGTEIRLPGYFAVTAVLLSANLR